METESRQQRDARYWRRLTSGPAELAEYARLLRACDSEVKAFLEIDPAKGAAQAGSSTHPLSGIPFGVKDNIAVTDFQLTCASEMLRGFISPYTATAVQRLLDCGAVAVGKLNMDEFGMGSTTANSSWYPTRNPWNHEYVPGGSSGGSAAAVALGMVPFALGSDTGGSVRQPAAFCGTYGLKPTYGAVSRYGLTAYASSLETVGILADSAEMVKTVFDVIRGSDPMDQTARWTESRPAAAPYTAAVLVPDAGVDRTVRGALDAASEQMRALGWRVQPASLKTLEYAVAAYYTIAAAEASANLARYTGIRYGKRSAADDGRPVCDHEQLVRRTRDEGFGSEVKLRILLGTYVLRSGFQDQYYTKAQKIRTLIRNEIEKLFSEADLILMPVFPVSSFRFDSAMMSPLQQKIADKFTVTANLAGIPSLAFPAGFSGGLPVGLQIAAPAFCEDRLFDAAGKLSGGRQIDLAPGHLKSGEGAG
jgi:aspartyl-tRNA(Asn)/glutamyl-tRNA(Gln) amidotransferase subunit A